VSGELFAQTSSSAFEVHYGDPYKLSITSFIGVAFGGLPFSANPIASIVDRGNNIVVSVNHGVIRAVLNKTPYNASMSDVLQPATNTVVGIINGSAIFKGLYINRAGYPYQIKFESVTQVTYAYIGVSYIAFQHHHRRVYISLFFSLSIS